MSYYRPLWVLCLSLLGSMWAGPAHAVEPCPASTGEGRYTAFAPCPERCSQSEACIGGRCISSCEIECREGTFCTELGTCQPIPRPLEPVRTEAQLQTQLGPNSKGYRSVGYIDLAAIFFEGVQMAYEWGEHQSWIVGVRPLSTGFLNYTTAPRNEFETFDYGASLSLQRRFYETSFGNLRGMYYGFGLEAFGVHVVNSKDRVERMTFDLAVLGHFGYRWAWDSLIVGFGPTISLRAPVYSIWYGANIDACSDNVCGQFHDLSFRGALNVEIGFFP
jgi:hypothetical protein